MVNYKAFVIAWLGVGHLFMTPVMVVIVIVEITCQEDLDSELGESVALLTRGDRGVGKRMWGDWGLEARLGCPDDFAADNQPPWPVG